MNCIIYAVFLPHIDKKYVLEEIFSYIREKEPTSKIFIGIQHNSIPETESILNEIKGDLDIETNRVPKYLMVNSDASSFVAALQLYEQSNMDFGRCYFVHSKGITSNNDPLRKQMFDEIFDSETIDKNFVDPNVGSYGPFLTLTDMPVDIIKMACMKRFSKVLTVPVMEYYYINTFYVIKNSLLRNFMKTISKDFFTTHINLISDRWMFERDFSHIADMQGYGPSFKHFHGNYSTGYKMPTLEQYKVKLNKWTKEIK